MNETRTMNGTAIKLVKVTPQDWLLVEVLRDSGNYKCFVKPEHVIRPAACSEEFKDLAFSGE